MTEHDKLAIQLATDTVRQVVTLSTAVTGVLVVVARDYRTDHASLLPCWLFLSGLCFLAAAAIGVYTLMAVTAIVGTPGELARLAPDDGAAEPTSGPGLVYDTRITAKAQAQMCAFGLGLVCTLLYLFTLVTDSG